MLLNLGQRSIPLLCVEQDRDAVFVVVPHAAHVSVDSEADDLAETLQDDLGVFELGQLLVRSGVQDV